jgi:hypothetical protein
VQRTDNCVQLLSGNGGRPPADSPTAPGGSQSGNDSLLGHGSFEAIQPPDDEDISWPHEGQRLGESQPIILGAGGVIFKQMPAADARRQQCITL